MVYEGVAGGGDLFQGQKFFIMLRVPARNELVKNVEVNIPFPVVKPATNFQSATGASWFR